MQNFINQSQRKTPFRNGLPGKGWYRAFIKRHPQLCLRTPEAVTNASACISEQDIKNWFKTIEGELDDLGHKHILQDHNRIFNGDETNFLLCPKNKKVLTCRGTRNVYEVDQGNAKTSLTVMFTFCANGDVTPPMIIYPYKRKPPKEILETVPDKWGLGYSDNGWMKSALFYEYIANIFNKYLVENNIEKPVILFVDGHKTHLTLQISELCNQLGIILVALYPNATRLLQPADVAAFKPLKSGWQKGILEWKREHPNLQFTKENFAPLLSKVVDNFVQKTTLINGFKATGLFPWDCNTIDYSKCLGGISGTINIVERPDKSNGEQLIETKVMDFKTFKQIIGHNASNLLESGNELTGSSEAESLNRLWRFFTDDDDKYDIENLPMDILENDKNTGDKVISPLDKTNLQLNIFSQTNSFTTGIENQEVVPMDILEDDRSNSDEVTYPLTETNLQLNIFSQPNRLKDIEDQEVADALNNYDANVEIVLKNESENGNREHDNSAISQILYWPESPKRKNKRNVERLPFVVTSNTWKSITEDKLGKKKLVEEEKAKRKKEREEKKVAKKNAVQKKRPQRKGKLTKLPAKKINIIQDIQILKPLTNTMEISNNNPTIETKVETLCDPQHSKNDLLSPIFEPKPTHSKPVADPPKSLSPVSKTKQTYSKTTVDTFIKTKFVCKGICYGCTFNITVEKMGRKCSGCVRTFHFGCNKKSNSFKENFLCNQCSE